MNRTSVAVVPSPAVTAAPLYEVEEYLAALIETAELVPPEQEEEFRLELEASLATAIDKRDRVGQFMSHLEQQVDFAKLEIERLRRRRSLYELALERIQKYVIGTIEHLGRDPRGRFRRLEGRTVTFSVRECPPSVDVSDESLVPDRYRILTLKLPAVVWGELLDSLEADRRAVVLAQVRTPEITIDKRPLKLAMESGVEVPGALLITGKHSLTRS